MSVTPLRPATAAPDLDVIDKLETALRLAKAGELRDVVIAGNMTENRVLTIYATNDRVSLAGQLTFLLHRVASGGDDV
jgi:hypothetical protein